jgi:uncharacterized membrane protein YheB (UPF0754 family)
MTDPLFLLAFPAVGALIGYVTNAAAIKMLFRPLKPVRIFGVRLPFTPGVLPRERHKLADSIGSMVERKLLTPELLREQLMREDARSSLRASIAKYTDKALECPLGILADGTEGSAAFLLSILQDFPGSQHWEPFIESLLESLASWVENSDISLGGLLGEERTGILREKIRAFLLQNLKAQTPQAVRYAASALDSSYSDLTSRFLQFLMTAEVHREMEIQGRIFLDNAIQKLSTLQRFFISAGQYDKTLRERMPEIIDSLIGQLETMLNEPDTRRRLTGFAEESLHNLVSRETSLETMTWIVSSLVLPYLAMPLKDALKNLAAAGDTRTLIPRIRELAMRKSGMDFSRLLGDAVSRIIDANKDVVLSDLLLINDPKKKKIDAYIEKELLKIADERMEGFIKSINISVMVSKRIDSLDMEEVEHIVLDVMAGQLKWINVFGAILGALIGGVQVLLSLINL